MQIWKRYKENDGLTKWEKTTPEDTIRHTEDAGYWKSDSVLVILSQGSVINTPWAQYCATNDNNPPVTES